LPVVLKKLGNNVVSSSCKHLMQQRSYCMLLDSCFSLNGLPWVSEGFFPGGQ